MSKDDGKSDGKGKGKGGKVGKNDAPDAVNDSASTNEDTFININVLANDTDANGDPLSIFSFSQPPNGTVSLNSNGTLRYTPDPNYNGPDSFTYTISDGNGGFDTATVSLTVKPVNDAPIAVDDIRTINEDSTININVLANDSDVDGNTLSVSGFTQPANGTVTQNANGTLKYTPNADYNGTDTFTYTVSDGNGGFDTATVKVNVCPVNDRPDAVNDARTLNEDSAININVLANDTDVDGNTLTVSSFTQPANGTVTTGPGGTLRYTPNANYNGSDSFTYTVSDGNGGFDTATVSLTVNPVNDVPVAVNDIRTLDEDNSIDINVLANDTDVDGNPLSVSTFTQPTNGTVTFGPGGTLTYTPNANYNGPDSFTYTVTDGQGGFSTATVSLTVNPLNDPPVAVDDIGETRKSDELDIDVLANDTDLEGDSLSVSGFTDGTYGTVSQNPDGTLKYTPNGTFVGTDTFEYTITDGNGGFDTATVTITIPCFTPGTLIETARGLVKVEQLRVGDQVRTRDNGMQRIEWIGMRAVSAEELRKNPNWRPIRILKGALGPDMPNRDMMVSPQHRMMLESDKAEMLLGAREVLAPAKALTYLEGVEVADVAEVTYVHIMCHEHEIVMGDGVWSESFQPGDMTIGAVDAVQRAELLRLFPQLLTEEDGVADFAAARPTAKPWEVPLIY
jgi:hypothetical protein